MLPGINPQTTAVADTQSTTTRDLIREDDHCPEISPEWQQPRVEDKATICTTLRSETLNLLALHYPSDSRVRQKQKEKEVKEASIEIPRKKKKQEVQLGTDDCGRIAPRLNRLPILYGSQHTMTTRSVPSMQTRQSGLIRKPTLSAATTTSTKTRPSRTLLIGVIGVQPSRCSCANQSVMQEAAAIQPNSLF